MGAKASKQLVAVSINVENVSESESGDIIEIPKDFYKKTLGVN